MTAFPIPLPFGGYTEQTQFSVVPKGMTPSCLNVMPSDIWSGRTRIGQRSATAPFSDGDVQFIGSFRAYISGSLVEKVIFVRGGKIYYAATNGTYPATVTLFDGQSTALLNTTGLVEGCQFNDYFYFVDGTNYVKVLLTATVGPASVWGSLVGPTGPFRTDPVSSPDGDRARLICRWGARLVLAGYSQTPHVWYACSPDQPYTGAPAVDGWDPALWSGAITGVSSGDYGTIPDPITAIFPFAQSGLMFGCTGSMHFLTTDPLFEESVNLVSLSRTIGIAGQRAWCIGPEKSAYILATDGLYRVDANTFNLNRASRVSAGRLDSFFLRLDFGIPATGGSSALSGGTLRGLLTAVGSATGTTAETIQGGTVSDDATATRVELPEAVSSLVGATTTGNVFPVLLWDPDREGVWMFLSVVGIEHSSLHIYYDQRLDSFWPQRFVDPLNYAPTSAVYIGPSRTELGRLFMGGGSSVSIMTKTGAVGIDGGFNSEATDDEQRARFIRSSLTCGPLMAQLPDRILIREVRVDLSEQDYEVPADFTDLSVSPVLSISTGETAEAALGLQTDALFVTNINPLEIDGDAAVVDPAVSNTYDGGPASGAQANRIDGRYSVRPFGQFEQNDPFASGTTRVYAGPGGWVIRWDTAASPAPAWTIARDISGWQIEYQQDTPDPGSPDGPMTTVQQIPLTPDSSDNALVSGASFPSSSVTEIGDLVPGRNDAKRCRIRAEAAYLTIASDGHPWSVERISATIEKVGRSRGGTA